MEMIPFFQSTSIKVKDFHEVGNARRQALSLAQSLKFNETESGKVGIVVTELANNLVKHAGGGEIVLRVLVREDSNGLEIMSLDKGPGMENVSRCLEDGYSTAGSPGTGLGAISRLAADLQIYSQIAKGTVIAASLGPVFRRKRNALVDIGVICRPVEGETESGDGWSIRTDADTIKILIVDGLGHGAIAAKAALAAIASFEAAHPLPLMQLIQTLHGALLSTRGAAVAIAEIDYNKEQLTFIGVGNISGNIISGQKTRGLASYNGTVGHQMHKIKEFIYPCPADALIIFHTDGVSPRWKMEDYSGLNSHPSNIISGVLYRDFQRIRDDATALTLKKC